MVADLSEEVAASIFRPWDVQGAHTLTIEVPSSSHTLVNNRRGVMRQKTWGFFNTAVRILNIPVCIWVFYAVSSIEVSGRKFRVIISSTPPTCLHCNHSWFNCPTLQWLRCRMVTFTVAPARSTWAVYVSLYIYIYTHRGADMSLARPGRKQTNVSVRMAWISFGALP